MYEHNSGLVYLFLVQSLWNTTKDKRLNMNQETITKHWYAAFVPTGEEDHVKRRLTDNFKDDFRFIVPKRVLKERRFGKWQEVSKTLFPGYVLINGPMTENHYNKIKKTMGLIKVLENEGQPLAIFPSEIQTIIRLTKVDELIGPSKVLVEGKTVQVIEGPLFGEEGMIVTVNKRKKRAKVRLNLFGEPRLIDLAIDVIEQVKIYED